MYFTDAHEELRLHIRRFLEKEVRPHLEEWEETTFPDAIMRRFGELGFLGLRYPPEYGGQGGDYFSAVVLSKRWPGRTAVAWGWRSPSSPRWPPRRWPGSEARRRNSASWRRPSPA